MAFSDVVDRVREMPRKNQLFLGVGVVVVLLVIVCSLPRLLSSSKPNPEAAAVSASAAVATKTQPVAASTTAAAPAVASLPVPIVAASASVPSSAPAVAASAPAAIAPASGAASPALASATAAVPASEAAPAPVSSSAAPASIVVMSPGVSTTSEVAPYAAVTTAAQTATQSPLLYPLYSHALEASASIYHPLSGQQMLATYNYAYPNFADANAEGRLQKVIFHLVNIYSESGQCSPIVRAYVRNAQDQGALMTIFNQAIRVVGGGNVRNLPLVGEVIVAKGYRPDNLEIRVSTGFSANCQKFPPPDTADLWK